MIESKRNRKFWETLVYDILQSWFFEDKVSHFCYSLKTQDKKKRIGTVPVVSFIIRYLIEIYESTYVDLFSITYKHIDAHLFISHMFWSEENFLFKSIKHKLEYLNMYALWYTDIEAWLIDKEEFLSDPQRIIFNDVEQIQRVLEDMKSEKELYEKWNSKTEAEIDELYISKWRYFLKENAKQFYKHTSKIEEKKLFIELTRRLRTRRTHWQTGSFWMKYELDNWNEHIQKLMINEHPYFKELVTLTKHWISEEKLNEVLSEIVAKKISDYHTHKHSHYTKALEYFWLSLVKDILFDRSEEADSNNYVATSVDKKERVFVPKEMQEYMLDKYWDTIVDDLLSEKIAYKKSSTAENNEESSVINRKIIKSLLRDTDIWFSNYLLYDLDRSILDKIFRVDASVREVHLNSLNDLWPRQKTPPKSEQDS